MQTVVVTGGTGFIGRSLVHQLRRLGYVPIVVAQHARDGVWGFNLAREPLPQKLIESAHAIIHLAGTSIFQRWTPRIKRSIYESRILSTRNIVASLRNAKKRPSLLIMASAVGYYGDTGEIEVDETTLAGDDFLAHVCRDWEQEANAAASLGVRTVQVRTAPVIGSGGGILAQLTPWYRSGLGSVWGSGEQWFPWVSLADIVNIYCFALEQPSLVGPVNAVAPGILRQEAFARRLADHFERQVVSTVPKLGLYLLLGDLATTVLNSQRVIPRKLLEHGYVFRHPTLEVALRAMEHMPQEAGGVHRDIHSFCGCSEALLP